MPAIAVSERTVATPLEIAFARFIDFSQWSLWMPDSFQPISGPARALRTGDRLKVGVGGKRGRIPMNLEVIRLRPNKELCWHGGPSALLHGEHSFLFAAAPEAGAGHTLIRSEESLTGLLTRGPLSSPIERVFANGASELLSSFAAYLQRATP